MCPEDEFRYRDSLSCRCAEDGLGSHFVDTHAVIYDQALAGLALSKSDPRFARKPAEPEQESMGVPPATRRPTLTPTLSPLGTALMERLG